jgi:hypothetical protein
VDGIVVETALQLVMMTEDSEDDIGKSKGHPIPTIINEGLK